MADESMFLVTVTHSLMEPLVSLMTRPSDQCIEMISPQRTD